MAIFLWSWFFIFPLLVQPGCAHHDSQKTDANVPRNPSIVTYFARSSSSQDAKRNNSTAIALGTVAGAILLAALIGFILYLRKRKRAMNQIEDGIGVPDLEEKPQEEKPQWWHIDLQSAKGTNWWVLESKGGGPEREKKNSADEDYPIKASSHLDHLLYFLSFKGATTQQHPEFPTSPDGHDPIARPQPVAPNSRPRYPSILDRPGNPPGFPPPSPFKNANLARTVRAVEAREKTNRRRAQVSPKANGRPVILDQSDRQAGATPGSTPGRRRRSWFSRQNFKNPFLPSEAVLPSSVSAGLAMRQQLAHSPRSRSKLSTPATSPPDASRTQVVRRVPVPIYGEWRTVQSPDGVRASPGTGGVPRPKRQEDQRALKSALPLGYPSRLPTIPKPV